MRKIHTISSYKFIKEMFCIAILFVGVILWVSGFKLQPYFNMAIVAVYVLTFPKYITSPKNVIFFYYFVWYVLAPMFANRYNDLYSDPNVDLAYMMFLTAYIVAMLTVDFFTEDIAPNIKYDDRKKNFFYIKFFFLSLGLVGLMIFIQRTGGLGLWLTDSYKAFFSRRNSGQFYLLFEYGFLLFLFLEGARGKSIIHPVMLASLAVCLVGCYFIGSKAVMMVLILMLYSRLVVKTKMISPGTAILGGVGLLAFVFGMYVRVGEFFTSVENSISTMLNYFDTFDEFLLVLRDYKASWFQTCFMPFNWIGRKLGFVSLGEYYDMSIWLTNVYYPDSWVNGGTHQWPIEADLFFNYKYIFGLPVLSLYFWLISKSYEMAQKRGGIWTFIYINEWIMIIGHLRGGIFLHIYFYLLPLYAVLIVIDKYFWEKISDETNRTKKYRIKRLGFKFVTTKQIMHKQKKEEGCNEVL